MFATLKESVEDTLRKESDALIEVLNNLKEEQVKKVYEIIKDCKGKIITVGCGTSGTAAKKIAHTLNCVNCPALFMSPSDATHGALGVVQEQDVVIFFSKGGSTKELYEIVPICKIRGATTIVVTEQEESNLAKEADYILKVKVSKEPDDFNMLATSSTLSTIAVFDAIAIAISRFGGYTKEEFAVIHPGGRVGERLTKK